MAKQVLRPESGARLLD